MFEQVITLKERSVAITSLSLTSWANISFNLLLADAKLLALSGKILIGFQRLEKNILRQAKNASVVKSLTNSK